MLLLCFTLEHVPSHVILSTALILFSSSYPSIPFLFIFLVILPANSFSNGYGVCLVLGGSVGIDNLLDVVLGSHHNWDTLVDLLGADLHNTLGSGSGHSTGLLHDEGHGGSLVQQTKLSVGVLGVTGVSENTSVQESTVDITDHRSNVPARELLSGLAGSLTPLEDSLLHGSVPLVKVGLVERDDAGLLGDLDSRLGQDKLSELLIKRKHVDTVSESQDEKGRRRVQAVGGGNKVRSGLKGVGETPGFLLGASLLHAIPVNLAVLLMFVDSNDGSGGDSGIDVGRSIEGVEHSNVTLTLVKNDL